MGDLNIAMKQMIEILKVIAFDYKIVCLDEPTSSLTQDETDRLFKMLAELKAKGVAIIYVSHRLEEIFKMNHEGKPTYIEVDNLIKKWRGK